MLHVPRLRDEHRLQLRFPLHRSTGEGRREAALPCSGQLFDAARPYAQGRRAQLGGRYAQGKRAQLGGRSRRNHSAPAYAWRQSEVSSVTLAP